MATLLVLSLGPVQEFIAAARKTRDLWFGSALLSEVARAAAQAVHNAGGELVFPAPGALNNTRVSIANKIVAVLHDGIKPADVATQAKTAAQSYLNSQRDETMIVLHNRR